MALRVDGAPHETAREHAARRTLGPDADPADTLDIWRIERSLTRNTRLIKILALVPLADLALTIMLLVKGGDL